jgi:hypothetical protein
MKRFSEIRKIKTISNPIKKGEKIINPLTLTIIPNTTENNVVLTQFFYDKNENTFKYSKLEEKKDSVHRTTSANVEVPNLSLPLNDILNMYDIDTYDELIYVIKQLIYENKPKNTVYRLINMYTRVTFDILKKNNNTLIKIFKIIFDNYKINDEKANAFLNKWFNKNNKDDFELNIALDFKNFLSN